MSNNFKNDELIKHSSAIHISNQISLMERKISNILLKYAFNVLDNKAEHKITIDELNNLLEIKGNTNYEMIKNAIRKLNKTQVEWNIFSKDNKNKWGVSTILASAEIESGTCHYAYSPALARLLKNPNIYAKLNMTIQAKFNSKYALALWEFLVEQLNTSKKNYYVTNWIDIKVFKRYLGVNNSAYYEEFKNLNRDILKKAMNEINEISEINVNVEKQKTSHKVTGLRFEIARKKEYQQEIIDKKEPNIETPEKINKKPSKTPKTHYSKENNLEANHNSQSVLLKQRLCNDFGFSVIDANQIIETYPSEYINERLDYTEQQSPRNKTAYAKEIIATCWSSHKREIEAQKENDQIINQEQNPDWKEALILLRKYYGDTLFKSWIKHTVFEKYQDNVLYISINGTKLVQNWINNHYKDFIGQVYSKVTQQQVSYVEIIDK